MISVTDDDLVRSHEEARAVLTYAVPGAIVEISRLRLRHVGQHNTERSRTYRVGVRRGGQPDLCVAGSYSLPVEAKRLTADLVERVRKASHE